MNERGYAGGFEVLPFGLLVFVAGSLLLTNAWAVVDGTIAASAAAREAVRAYVEAGSAEEAHRSAVDAGLATIDGHGRDPARAAITWTSGPSLARCARNTIVVRYKVPTLTVPFVGSFGGGFIETSGQHSELVDPYRSGLPLGDATTEPCRG